MITIMYPTFSPKVAEWKERLKELSVSFQLIEDKDIELVSLAEGKNQAKGELEINQFIEELAVDVGEWCKCVCD